MTAGLDQIDPARSADDVVVPRPPAVRPRRGYIDWLRGLAVLVMIEAHTFDSWTLPADRSQPLFGYLMVLGGFGAPLFLFLAGVAVALSAGSKLRKTGDRWTASRAVQRRGWEIFGLAFLFRLQAFVLSGSGDLRSMLKVDILNIMGPGIILAGLLWGLGTDTKRRLLLFAAVTIAMAMLTPIVREAAWLAPLPDPIEWYLRPRAGWTNFTIFPWAGFLFAGGCAGVLLDEVRNPRGERKLQIWFAVAGAVLALGGYYAAYLPTIYARSSFWTSSPTFFFLRVGILLLALVSSYAWEQRPTGQRWSPMQVFGRASLFIYWIHVEMVYGVLSAGIHKRLPLNQVIVAFALFTLFLFGVSVLKTRLAARLRGGRD